MNSRDKSFWKSDVVFLTGSDRIPITGIKSMTVHYKCIMVECRIQCC